MLAWSGRIPDPAAWLFSRNDSSSCGSCKTCETSDQREAGGHIHVERSLTGHQSCRGWEIALSGLTGDQARALNMRHATPGRNYYCKLYEGDHRGKHCAVNGEHERTIELRTFGAWDCSTACKLAPAIKWVHGMWEWFESWPPAGVPDDWLAIDEKVRTPPPGSRTVSCEENTLIRPPAFMLFTRSEGLFFHNVLAAGVVV